MFQQFWVHVSALTVAFLLVTMVGLGSARSVGRKTGYVVANLGLVISLWFFLHPPSIPGLSKTPKLGTPGTQNLLALGEGDYVLAESDFDLEGIKARPVTGIEMFRHLEPASQVVEIMGPGLSRNQILASKGLKLDFKPMTPPNGFVFADWMPNLFLGESLRVEGKVATAVDAVISMYDPFGNQLASSNSKDSLDFFFETVPKASGRYVYQLKLEQGDKLLASERIPVEVRSPRPPIIHYKAAAPNFENNYFRRWARQVNIPVYFDIWISADKYRRQWSSNTAKGDAEKPGLWIVDLRRWENMDSNEQALILEQVSSGNAGLLIIADSVQDPQNFGEDLVLSPSQSKALSYPLESNAIQLETGLVAPSGRWSNSLPLPEPLKAYSGLATVGNGNIAYTLIADSFRLASSGYSRVHGLYWKTLVDELVVHTPEDQLSNFGPRFVTKRSEICLSSDDAKIVVRMPGGRAHELPLKKSLVNSKNQCAFFWPEESGWHELQTNNSTLSFFVFESRDFLGWRQWQRSLDTLVASSGESIQAPTNGARDVTGSRVGPFLLFMTFALWVWLEQKSWRGRNQLM